MAVAHKFLENNIGLLINRMEVNFTGIALRDIGIGHDVDDGAAIIARCA